MNIGLDASDALRPRKDQVNRGTIWGLGNKAREEFAIPVSATLQAMLNRMEKENRKRTESVKPDRNEDQS